MEVNKQIQARRGGKRLCVQQAFVEGYTSDRLWDVGRYRVLEWKTIGEPLNGMLPILEEWESNRLCSQLGRDGLLGEFVKLGVRDMHPLLDTQFGQLWMDFFVAGEGQQVFGMAYAWLTSRMQPLTLTVPGDDKVIVLRENTPAEFQNSLTTSLDVPNCLSDEPSITFHPQSRRKLIKNASHAWPRRIWDLCSNRVIPFQFLPRIFRFYATPFWAVSHSWTSDMELTWSEVNSYEWPIPLPRGVTLTILRKRLLELGAQYCWVDVVCLRQALPARLTTPVPQPKYEYPERKPLPEEQVWNTIVGWSKGSHEQRIRQLKKWQRDWKREIADAENKRRLEWELDVPTIGVIYRKAELVVYYLNGLMKEFERESLDCSLCGSGYRVQNPMCRTTPLPGSPFKLHSEDERHWFNRAWTVQEVRRGMIPGFDVKEVSLHALLLIGH